jgi:plasmid stability protein
MKRTKTRSIKGKAVPVRLDLPPPIHRALRIRAAQGGVSMMKMARRLVGEALGFKEGKGAAW